MGARSHLTARQGDQNQAEPADTDWEIRLRTGAHGGRCPRHLADVVASPVLEKSRCQSPGLVSFGAAPLAISI